MPGTNPAPLRPYQQEGINFLAARGRGVLADEPGVGTTRQALVAVRRMTPRGRVLVVCPKNATGVWMDQCLEWIGEPAVGYNGTGRKAEDLAGSFGFVITNYTLMREALEQGKFSAVIFDESHKLRNRRKTKKRGDEKASPNTLYGWLASHRKMLPEHLLFLTGTPIVGDDASEVWTTLNLLDPVRYSSYWAFAKKFTNSYHNGFGWVVEGIRNEQALWKELGRWFIRRRKSEVQQYLPDKVRQRIPLQMTTAQRRVYRELVKEHFTESADGYLVVVPGKLAEFTRLRQLLACPRILGINDDGAAIEALTEDLLDRPRPIVVFTPFAEALPYIEQALEAAKAGWVIQVHGGMTAKAIAEAVATFKQAEPDLPLVLACTVQMGTSWSAAGTASEAYFLEYDWSPGINIQAEDRLHREGAVDTVFAKYFVHEGTLDRHVLEINEAKVTVAQLALDPAFLIDF